MLLDQSLSFIQDRVKNILEDAGFEKIDQEIMLDIPDKDKPEEGIYVSLLYLEEEKTLKNNNYLQTFHDPNKPGVVTGYRKVNPKLYLNLYVLITSTAATYSEALKHISCVLSAFQIKNVFSRNTIVLDTEGKKELTVDDFGAKYDLLDKLVFEIHTLTFEQNNSLWQTMGGKIYPYIIYKVKTVAFAEPEGEPDMKPIDSRVGLVKPISEAPVMMNSGDKDNVEGENAETSIPTPAETSDIVWVESNDEFKKRKQKKWKPETSSKPKSK